jgi:hypothetical protein
LARVPAIFVTSHDSPALKVAAMQAMHGQLRVDSEPGLGSCFTITLPGIFDAAARSNAHGHHE